MAKLSQQDVGTDLSLLELTAAAQSFGVGQAGRSPFRRIKKGFGLCQLIALQQIVEFTLQIRIVGAGSLDEGTAVLGRMQSCRPIETFESI
jgi:hypothetical protein